MLQSTLFRNHDWKGDRGLKIASEMDTQKCKCLNSSGGVVESFTGTGPRPGQVASIVTFMIVKIVERLSGAPPSVQGSGESISDKSNLKSSEIAFSDSVVALPLLSPSPEKPLLGGQGPRFPPPPPSVKGSIDQHF